MKVSPPSPSHTLTGQGAAVQDHWPEAQHRIRAVRQGAVRRRLLLVEPVQGLHHKVV